MTYEELEEAPHREKILRRDLRKGEIKNAGRRKARRVRRSPPNSPKLDARHMKGF